MKNIKSLAVILFFSGTSILAQEQSLKIFVKANSTENFISYKTNNPLTAELLVNRYKTDLGLSANAELRLSKKENDSQGFTHYRFQQYFNGVEVFGSQYLVHEKSNSLTSSNGKLTKGIEATIGSAISPNQAIQKAIAFIGAKQYMWQVNGNEQELKRIKNDANTTYFPTAKLVWFDKYFTQVGSQYQLAYKVEVFAQQPLVKKDVFVSATTGEILHSINKIHTTEVDGTAITKYAGTKSIKTDSVAVGQYRLREVSRGGGLETYNMQQGTNYGAAIDFTDTDNLWNNVNAQQDEAATDAHWSSEMTYDYYFTQHSRNSYDNAGTKLLSYVHYDIDYANAFWDGLRMTYGDGDGTTYTALTSLDVCGHEITHGVTEYTANLVYQNESGALNESFSDVFGTAIEFYGDPTNADWFIGEDFDVNGDGFRSMEDPNSKNDPDTYLGNFWEFTAADNGGVHTNSGVQNHWFYLLSVGGTGTNDNGYTYSLAGIGIDKAAAIAYRNLSVYLTQSSTYWDARLGSIQAAEDLYGACSNEVLETSKAWAAVGVGFAIEDNDLTLLSIESPFTACALTNAENVEIVIRNNGCVVDLPIGTNIPVSYQVDGGTIINETIVLANSFNADDSLTYTFTTSTDLSTIGNHTVSAWVKFSADAQPLNDSIIGYAVENKIQQNVDLALTEIVSPNSDCHLGANEPVIIKFQFLGCDSLSAGTNIDLVYELDGQPSISEPLVLPQTIYANDFVNYTFANSVNISSNGTHTLNVRTAYGADIYTSNDSINNHLIKNPYPVIQNQAVTFENVTAVLDTMILKNNVESDVLVSNVFAATGTKSLQFTGGDPINSGITPNLDTVGFWLHNIEFAAEAKFCVDATAWTSANMQFDLKQTMSKVYNLQFGQLVPEASSLRVVANGTQVSPNYRPTTESGDPFVLKQLSLSAYAGTEFEVVFETRMGFSKAADPTSGFPFLSQGDNAFVDNLIFSEFPVGVAENNPKPAFAIYPNPTDGFVTLQLKNTKNESVTIEVLNIVGEVVYSLTKNLSSVSIDLSSQPNGIYLLKVTTNEQQTVEKLIKQ